MSDTCRFPPTALVPQTGLPHVKRGQTFRRCLQVFHCLEDFLDTLFYDWQILSRDLPHRFDIHTHIIVNQHVAQPGDAAPWDLRMLGAELLRQPLGCLPYDFKLANDGVLPMRGGNEDIMTHGNIGFDFFDGV